MGILESKGLWNTTKQCGPSGGGDLITKKKVLWVKIIQRKYNLGEDCHLPCIHPNMRASAIWEDICSLGQQRSSLHQTITQGFRMMSQITVLGSSTVGGRIMSQN